MSSNTLPADAADLKKISDAQDVIFQLIECLETIHRPRPQIPTKLGERERVLKKFVSKLKPGEMKRIAALLPAAVNTMAEVSNLCEKHSRGLDALFQICGDLDAHCAADQVITVGGRSSNFAICIVVKLAEDALKKLDELQVEIEKQKRRGALQAVDDRKEIEGTIAAAEVVWKALASMNSAAGSDWDLLRAAVERQTQLLLRRKSITTENDPSAPNTDPKKLKSAKEKLPSGRPPVKDAKMRKYLVESWNKASLDGISKKDFVMDLLNDPGWVELGGQKITVRYLNTAIDWDAKRRSRQVKSLSE